ncbi:MAG: phage protein Gp27 family protein [Pseudomonadota bacterium]
MPPPRKINLLPAEQLEWVKTTLKSSGFSGYEQIAEALNERLQAEGLGLTIGKSALHSFGKEYAHFVRYQEEASAWAADWLNENGLEDEAQRHNVLFQMVTTLAFKVMQAKMAKNGEEIDAKELHFLGRMLKDVMSSSGIRQKLLADERKRISEEAALAERKRIADELESVVSEGGLTDERAKWLRKRVLGEA